MSAWRDLSSTAYGRAVLVKIALDRRHRRARRDEPLAQRPGRRHQPRAAAPSRDAASSRSRRGASRPRRCSARCLRRRPGCRAARPERLGRDFGTTVRVALTAASDQPGPNRFVVRAVDYDSSRRCAARRVSLRFTPLDDPGVEPSTLLLSSSRRQFVRGIGRQPRLRRPMAGDGADRAGRRLRRGAAGGRNAEPAASSSPSSRIPGQPPQYTVQVKGVRARAVLSAIPSARAGARSTSPASTGFSRNGLIEEIVVTAAAGEGPARQLPVRRLDRSRFVADVELQPGLEHGSPPSRERPTERACAPRSISTSRPPDDGLHVC